MRRMCDCGHCQGANWLHQLGPEDGSLFSDDHLPGVSADMGKNVDSRVLLKNSKGRNSKARATNR